MQLRFYILLLLGSWCLTSFAAPSNHTVGLLFVQQDTAKTDSVKPYVPSFRPTYNPSYRYGDPFSFRVSRSPLTLPDPSNLELQIDYDSGFQYTVFERIGNLNFRPVTTMSFSEYDRYNDGQVTQSYWREKSTGLDGESAVSGRRLIPKLYLSPVFDRIFGGSYVDITPSGFINLDFGGTWQNVDNPSIPQRQQQNGGFNFDQQISMNLVGRVGDKLEITANFDNNNTFDFQNNMRIEYTGYDEEIIKKIIIGNVSMPVANSLMSGSQTLFGIKTEMQFGKLWFTGVASRQQGSLSTSTLGGSGSIDDPMYNPQDRNENELRASAYDENRHFFLSHFFRDNYEKWLKDPRNITSGVQIRTVEVYITNTNNTTTTTRNTVGFIDLGEQSRLQNQDFYNAAGLVPSDNSSNQLYGTLINSGFRISNEIYNNMVSLGLDPATEFVVTGTSRQLVQGTEFIFNEKLGYITLLSPLVDNQSLAVAYQYSYNGQTFTVGELSGERRLPDDQSIFLKLLRPNSVNTELPTWDLMMKNIYNLRASQIDPLAFKLRIKYRDDASGIDNPSLHEGGANVENFPLVQLLGLDQYNLQLDPQPDGLFDFIKDVTINPDKGYIIFPVLEPFGSTLRKYFNENTQADLIEKYVYTALYDDTRQIAVNDTERDKYRIAFSGAGSASSSGKNNVIKLEGFQVTPGSVIVRMGNVTLEEGRHYTVDYNFGQVTIIDEAVLNSGIPITATSEAADLFNFQTTWFYGARLDYRFNERFNVGATVLHLNERRGGISRFNIGNEPMKNTQYGFDIAVTEESRFLTKMVDAIPLVSTKEQSEVTFTAEYARFVPGTSNDVQGEPTSYIDDFETAVTPMRLDGWFGWKLGTTPETNTSRFFNQSALPGREFNYRKAKIAWYNVDNSVFYRVGGNRPDHLSDEDLSNHYVRAVIPQEIFKQRDPAQINLNENLLDIAYFPRERGQQNYNPNLLADGTLPSPTGNYGAITRGFEAETNFINSNFQYIEFWLMDPFIDGVRGRVLDGLENTNNTTGGELIFNLGSISEDVVPDGTFYFENGLPEDGDPSGSQLNPNWGRTPGGQYLTGFFSNNANARQNQDVGFDGLRDPEERTFFNDFLSSVNPAAQGIIDADVSADNFQYYLGGDLDARNANIVERYKSYNGTDGNSPFNNGAGFTPANSTLPDKEDVNDDNTISFLEEYFEYRIPLQKGNVDLLEYVVDEVQDQSGEATWYQFRIPLDKFTGKYGNPSFQNIRFMRMYFTGWQQPVVLRFAKFQMTRGAWRKYELSLQNPGLGELPEPQVNDFDISVVSIEENSTGSATQPPYVVPPGLTRDVNNLQTVNTRYNEQSLQICIEDLANGDARAAFKNQNFDLINYDRLEMFFHAHSYQGDNVQDGDVNAFIRLGQDNASNYYEIEIPLAITPLGLTTSSPGLDRQVWPSQNEVVISLDQLKLAKVQRNTLGVDLGVPFSYVIPNTDYRVTVVGNPELNDLQTMMIGARNPNTGADDDGLTKTVCLWANEFRATGYQNSPGWAANAALQAKLADLGGVNLNTRYSSIGFGGLNTTISQRNRFAAFEYQAGANLNLEKFMYPEKTGLVVPMMVNFKKERVTPQYDPLNQDILLEESLKLFATAAEKDKYQRLMEAHRTTRSINFSNVRKEKVKEDAKSRIYDIENFSFTYAYSDEMASNNFTQSRLRKNIVGGINYDYSPVAISWEPFTKSEAFSSPYLQLIKDINFSPLPTNFSFSANLNRSYTRTQFFNNELTTEGIAPNFERLFSFNRLYNLRWDIFKSFSFDYNANVRAVIDEPEGIIIGDINTRSERRYIWDQIFSLGRMKQFDQNMTFTYKTPLGKLPFTDWLGADLRYVGGYIWTAGPINQTDVKGNSFGNIIQNRRDRGVNGKIDMVKLYDKVTFLNSANKSTPEDRTFGQSSLLTMMALRSINITYNIRETTSLTGFKPQPLLFGLDSGFNAPGFGFIMGDQDPHIRFLAAQRGWLTQSPFLTAPFQQSKGTDLAVRGTLQPFTDLSIQLDFTKANTNGYQEIFRYDTLQQRHVSLTPSRSGTYSISFLTIATAFEERREDNFSSAFAQFEENLETMLQRLNESNPNGDYDPLSQDVLIPAFLAAYSGKDADTYRLNPFPRIPMPNWRMDYTGLMRIPAISDMFASITLSTGYRSVYTVGNFTNNLRYSDNLTLDYNVLNYPKATQIDTISGTLVPNYIINQVMISEQFAPLFGINFRTKSNISTRLEFKKERNLALNMSNAQITETTNNDVTLDFGYSKVGFKIPWRFQGRTYSLPNNLTMRTAFTIRDSNTIQRKIDGLSLVTNGSFSYQIRPTITYNINQQLDFTMYFERTVTEPKILSSFRRATTAFGFQLRFNLSQ